MSIKYKSTRGKMDGMSFEQVVLGGLAHDRGLFVPEIIPSFSMEEIERMRGMTFNELAFEVISKFVGAEDISAKDLRVIIDKSFASFRTSEVAPSVRLKDFWILELFHGPTFAFKDVALQFLGNIFEYFLTRGNIQSSITILGATSGDTGSAAIHGLRGKANVNCFIMFPIGKVTEIQERQMTTIQDSNIHCIGINGDFDDCQALVKGAFNDKTFREAVNLGAVNSINWARVLAQITYYFYSWLRVTDSAKNGDETSNTSSTNTNIPKVSFAVPTGNFGDILAGFYAKRMGLPVDHLIICTNENDVLRRFLQTGRYSKTPAVRTVAPSMDISVSSNFERYLYYLAGESPAVLSSWMSVFEATGEVSVPPNLLKKAQADFGAFTVNKNGIVSTMADLMSSEQYLVCPHTATAVAAVRDYQQRQRSLGDLEHRSNCISVCLATAHPAKFEEAVGLALSGAEVPPRPEALQVLFGQPTRKTLLRNSLSEVQKYIHAKLPPSDSGSNTSLQNKQQQHNSSFWSTQGGAGNNGGGGGSDDHGDDDDGLDSTSLLMWIAAAGVLVAAGLGVLRYLRQK